MHWPEKKADSSRGGVSAHREGERRRLESARRAGVCIGIRCLSDGRDGTVRRASRMPIACAWASGPATSPDSEFRVSRSLRFSKARTTTCVVIMRHTVCRTNGRRRRAWWRRRGRRRQRRRRRRWGGGDGGATATEAATMAARAEGLAAARARETLDAHLGTAARAAHVHVVVPLLEA
jgi:hypothetical protein